MFQEALQRYNLDPSEVIYIGDSILSDVCGAQNVGSKAIWLNRLNKKGPEGISPNFTCKDLFEVRDIFNNLLR